MNEWLAWLGLAGLVKAVLHWLKWNEECSAASDDNNT